MVAKLREAGLNPAVAEANAAEAGSVPALSVEGVSHSFGTKRVLDDVEFSILPGQFGVLLGLNGAGKTTLFSLITRLHNSQSGTIRVFGWNVRDHPSQVLARMGTVFQQPAIDLDLTVAQNLRYHASLHGMSRAEARRRLEEELARLEMSERTDDKVRQLSGGQRRRIEIARALMHRPRLLLLDEPTVGLDINARQAIIDHVRRLCRDEGMAVLWASHLIDEVGSDDRVIVLHKGRVLAFGDVDQVVGDSGTKSIAEAFSKITGKAAA